MEDYLPHIVALRRRLLVLADADPGGALDEAEALLAPLDANLELEPYALPCPCIEMRADDASCGFAGEAPYQRGPEKSLYISSLSWANPDPVTEEGGRRTEGHHEDFTRLFRSHKETYLRNLLPYPDCEGCGGTGVRRGLHNPEGRWFSWEAVEDAEGFGGDSRVAARGCRRPRKAPVLVAARARREVAGQGPSYRTPRRGRGGDRRGARQEVEVGGGGLGARDRWATARARWVHRGVRPVRGRRRQRGRVRLRLRELLPSAAGRVAGADRARVTPRTQRRYRYQDAALCVGRDGFWRASELRAEAPGVGAWTGRGARW